MNTIEHGLENAEKLTVNDKGRDACDLGKRLSSNNSYSEGVQQQGSEDGGSAELVQHLGEMNMNSIKLLGGLKWCCFC